MSLVTLLSLQDDQIDVVTEAVRRWCDANDLDINSECGRLAVQSAVAIALTADKWDPDRFRSRLELDLTAQVLVPPTSFHEK
jgi:hypothetical protein